MKIFAATRIKATDANEAGKIVLFLEKALGIKGRPLSGGGTLDRVIFNYKNSQIMITLNQR